MINKFGPKKFLKLFWQTFHTKYFPKPDENGYLPPARRRDWSDGQSIILALMLGTAFVGTPIAALIFGGPENLCLDMIAIFIIFGTVFLAIPTVMAVSLVIKLNKSDGESTHIP